MIHRLLKKLTRLQFWPAVGIASLALNALLIAGPALADREVTARQQDTLQQLLFYMQNLYVEPIQEETLLEGAIRGLLQSSGDPYTRYLNEDEFSEFLSMEQGRRIGIGVEVSMEDGLPIIIAPLPGGPADRAGVMAGDRIVSIEGHETEGMEFGRMIQLIGGERNSVVRIEVGRTGVPDHIAFEITRDEFQLDYVHPFFFEEQKIGYIRLLHFFGEEGGSIERFRAALEDFQRKQARGLIIDLRDNTGGHLQMASLLTGYFLKPGQVIVSARGRIESMNTTFSADQDAGLVSETMPVVVLVNGGSASASEIMAGALQDHRRATLIGTRTFGKASVQRVIRPLPNDAAAMITIQKYFTPLDRAIHGQGLTPDIVVSAIQPSGDDNFYLNKMSRAGFFTEFRRAHPNYSNGLVETFRRELTERGYRLSDQVALLVLKREYRLLRPETPDLETDPQLRRALLVLGRPSGQ